MPQADLKLTVIVCTYNPRIDLLAKALRSLSTQTLSPRYYEVIVVDNNSKPPLQRELLQRLCLHKVDLQVEKRQGLVFARVAGIYAGSTDVFVFVDDDNELAPDYLENALRIAKDETNLGTFGGRCFGVLEGKVSGPKRAFLPHLGVRDVGSDDLTGSGETWGPHEPIGAGIVVRRPVAEAYAALVETHEVVGRLGRSGAMLMSGEDSLLSRIAHRMGFECGYRPQLHLKHHITKRRLTYSYLRRLLQGQGYCFVLIETISGRAVANPPARETKMLAENFMHRWSKNGLIEAVGMIYWDRGYLQALRERSGWKDSTDLLATIHALRSAGREA
ncbi:glycosyltransferase [Hyphomicrobium sp.]|uniref:glycosyltransferase n=1 Tax=Hyphomicrobium sp. TaxID=82 RepID=UPI0025C1363B|nr:glycosyltransferase [Hyphomicrobium sp.]MCC7253457.1 glycosyltransferase family 2 protein [Hyphomicrobium sp.]